MSSRLKPLESAADQSLSTDHAESLRQFNRTPRPYTHDGVEVSQDVYNGHNERDTGIRDVVSEQGPIRPTQKDTWHGRSGQASIAGSESGTEADDERPSFVRALPPATLRPRKGLKTGEKNEDALLTPSQLDDEGRRLSYYRHQSEDGKGPQQEDSEAEQEKLLRIRLAELARRSSEVALMGVTTACVLCGRGVLRTASQWHRELVSSVVILTTLILAYPVKLSIVDTRAQHNKLWQRFRVPASFDPATVLYPTLLPVLVALSVSPGNPAVILPNIILGLASLPQRLFPRSSRLGGFNTVHWLVSVIPLILSEHTEITFQHQPSKPYMLKSGPPYGLSSETLVSLYPLHHALLVPLHYLTTTSLLISELHLLSAVLINLLLMTASPQMVILKACLWIGGVAMCVFTGPVLHWGVTLARVPRWKLRRPGHSAEERKPLVDAVSELINLQRAAAAFQSPETADSDADEDEPPASIKEKANGVPAVATSGVAFPAHAPLEPKSAIEPPLRNGFLPKGETGHQRPRRNTLPPPESPQSAQRVPSIRRKTKSKPFWCLQLTPAQAERRKWLYAAYVYAAVVAIVLGPVRSYITLKALHGQEPFCWAIGYLFGQIPLLHSMVDALGLRDWIMLPSEAGDWHDLALSLPLDVNGSRHILGSANVRLLLIAYWAIVLLVGLLAVFSLTAFVEVDTRRKVFHGVMVAMLVPSIFVDPCYGALALALVLAVFLLLEVIRAGQVPPLGNAIGRFVAPYVDGRDLRGPVVVSHIFLLIGCAVPLWFSLASIDREGEPPWIGWELAGNTREVAMIAGVVCVGMGDAAASLIGRRYGRHKWIWVGGKSLEGSAAFVAAVTIGLVAAKAWQVFGGWSDTVRPLQHHIGASGTTRFMAAWLVTLVKAVFCACGASFMEAVLTGANDNVVVPVALWLLVKGSRL
ncbi:hypothetical protein LTR85_003951 [Meristemomyces frigidus]|nr:hypothetical protein LTR85_003951 [Meristemomyces frigidus]